MCAVCGMSAFVLGYSVGGLVCPSGSVYPVHLYFALASLSMSLGSWWCFVQGVSVGDPTVLCTGQCPFLASMDGLELYSV